MKFIIASKNKKKISELERILTPLGIKAVTENDLNIKIPEVEETGTTFQENAFLKANSACKTSGLPAIADDSGLCVDSLNGAPGIYSSRFSGDSATDENNNALLIEKLKNISKEKRTAKFCCAISVVFPNGDEIKCFGECKGLIGFEPSGQNGFGYDPYFYVGDKSFASLSADEKDKISHRGNALRELKIKLKEYLDADK
ncbi:MAG: XTP/dITP diphosphatase [Clostridia bacterium]|nr:XTP/dITP diphosphatase [Clostridia bacterium]